MFLNGYYEVSGSGESFYDGIYKITDQGFFAVRNVGESVNDSFVIWWDGSVCQISGIGSSGSLLNMPGYYNGSCVDGDFTTGTWEPSNASGPAPTVVFYETEMSTSCGSESNPCNVVSPYNGPSFNEWLFVSSVIAFLLGFITWKFIFGVFKSKDI